MNDKENPIWSYFVEVGRDATNVRTALDALGVSYVEKPWQAGIRQFMVDASDPAKLRQVFLTWSAERAS